MRVLQDKNGWYIELDGTRSRSGPYGTLDSATTALQELRRLKRLLATKLGYELVRPLGSGGYGEVWLANAPGDVKVALKIAQMGRSQGRREFKSLARYKNLKHTNLSPVLAFWLVELPEDDESVGEILKHDEISTDLESTVNVQPPSPSSDTAEDLSQEGDQTLSVPVSPSDGPKSGKSGHGTGTGTGEARDRGLIRLIIAMQLGDMTLADKLAEFHSGDETLPPGNNGIPERLLLKYIEQAGDAIHYLNEKAESQHCDIKPQNILLVSDNAQVCDFGILRQTGDTSAQRGPEFTPLFAAPEQHRKQHSDRIDQYSLALTYARLYTGVFSVQCKTSEEAYHKKLNHDLDFRGIKPQQCKVLQRATMPDPEDRYESVEEFIRNLKAAQVEDNRSWFDRLKKLAVVLVGCLAILAVGVAIYYAVWGATDAKTEIRAHIGQHQFAEAMQETARLKDREEQLMLTREVLERWWDDEQWQAADGVWDALAQRDATILGDSTVEQIYDKRQESDDYDAMCGVADEFIFAGKRDTLLDEILTTLEGKLDEGSAGELDLGDTQQAERILDEDRSPGQAEFRRRWVLLCALVPVRANRDVRQLTEPQVAQLRSVASLASKMGSEHERRATFCDALCACMRTLAASTTSSESWRICVNLVTRPAGRPHSKRPGSTTDTRFFANGSHSTSTRRPKSCLPVK